MRRPSLYRPYFTPAERALLRTAALDDLSDEIELMRVLLARLLAALQRAPALNLQANIDMLCALSAACLSLARMVRVQSRLSVNPDPLANQLEEFVRFAVLECPVNVPLFANLRFDED